MSCRITCEQFLRSHSSVSAVEDDREQKHAYFQTSGEQQVSDVKPATAESYCLSESDHSSPPKLYLGVLLQKQYRVVANTFRLPGKGQVGETSNLPPQNLIA